MDDESDSTPISSDALARLDLRRRSESLIIKTFSGTARINLVSGAFQALPLDQSESVNIIITMVVNELPISRPTKIVSDRIRNFPHLSDIPNEETEADALVVIGCDFSEAH